jgi:hypothetical protein
VDISRKVEDGFKRAKTHGIARKQLVMLKGLQTPAVQKRAVRAVRILDYQMTFSCKQRRMIARYPELLCTIR